METQTERSIGVCIVDHHAVLRAGLRMVIERQPHMHVVGEAACAHEALAIAEARRPDVILLDLDLGDENGLDLLPRLLEVVPESRVLLLTGLRNPAMHRQAVLLGAMGLVLKEKPVETVIRAIETVYAGEVWLEVAVNDGITNGRDHLAQARAPDHDVERMAMLTDREREVIRLIGEGLKNKQIAEHLSISEATVRHHLTSIFSKLNVADRFELVVYAYRHGLAGQR
jgi:DNA-binding NarL/FixJ family response regulator